jgi:hypothetical protein
LYEVQHDGIDVSRIPEHVKHVLAAATYESVRAYLRQPGGKEALDARIAARAEEQKAAPAAKRRMP